MGLNAVVRARCLSVREVVAGALEHLRRDRSLDPSLKEHRLLRFGRKNDVEILARRALHDVPAVARALGVMDDQRRDRSAPRRFLELVGPAAVVGHRLAGEFACDRLTLSGFEVRIVDQEDGDLALQVDALEVVPPALGRIHSISDEDHRGARDPRLVHRTDGAEIDVLREAQRGRLARLRDRQARRLQLGADHRHRLRPAAVLTAGLQPRRLELLGQISDRLLLARSAHRAALELVRRQHSRDLGHALGTDRRSRDGRRLLRRSVEIGGRCLGRSGFAPAQSACQQQRGNEPANLHRTSLDRNSPTVRALNGFAGKRKSSR